MKREEIIISIIIAYLHLERKENRDEINIQYFLNYIYNLMDIDKKSLKQISNNLRELLEG